MARKKIAGLIYPERDLNHIPAGRPGGDGWIYAVQFTGHTIKVGRTTNPRSRVGRHATEAQRFGSGIERVWVSPQHPKYVENEVELIALAENGGQRSSGNEYFDGVSFDRLVRSAAGLDFTQLSAEQVKSRRDERKGHQLSARETLGQLRGSRNSATSMSVADVQFRGDSLTIVEVDGDRHIVLNPAFTAIGLNPHCQIVRLKAQPWATTAIARVPCHGKFRECVTADIRSFLMHLATIPTSRVAEHVRPKLLAYQCEVAAIIEAHFNGTRKIVDTRRALGDLQSQMQLDLALDEQLRREIGR